MIGRITIAAVVLTTLVAIVWVRAESPTLANSAPEASLSTDVPRDREVEVGGSFEIEVSLRNKGGVGDHGGISVSFPDLATGNVSSSKRFTSDLADIEVDDFTDGLGDVVLYAPGDDIWHTNGDKFPARHLLVESDSSPWENGDSRTLTLTVHANEPGELEIRVRGWICRSRYDECSRDPIGKSRKDQQGHSVDRYTINIIEHTAELTSCQGSPNPVATDQTLTLRARVFVPRNAARKPLHVEFGFNGGRYETDDIRVDRGKRKTFTYQLTPPSPGNYYLSCRLFADDKRVDTRYATSRVRVAVPPPSPPVIVSVQSQVVSPARGAPVSVSGSAMSVRVQPGEKVEFRATAQDRNGDVIAARWNAPHSLMSVMPDTFTSSSLRQTGDFQAAFPIEGRFNVSATFVDARGASATARWSITVDDGRDDLASAANQIGHANLTYYSNLVCDESEPVCRDLGGMRAKVGAVVDDYHAKFDDEIGEAKIAETQNFLISNGYVELGEDARNAARYLNLGAICGQMCWDLRVEGYDTLFYTIGWRALGIIPGADVGADARDALWLGGKCIEAAIYAIFGPNNKSCDAQGLAIGTIALVPLVGKSGDAAQIIHHVKRMVHKGLLRVVAKFARFALNALDKLGLGKPAEFIRTKLRDSDMLFRIYLEVKYPNIAVRLPEGIESITDVKGFKEIKGILRSDKPRIRLGAERLLETLEEERFHGWTIKEFNRVYRHRINGVTEHFTDVDAVLSPPKSDDVSWLETHGLFVKNPDPVEKAERLLDAPEISGKPADMPDEVIYKLYYELEPDPANAARVRQTKADVESMIATLHDHNKVRQVVYYEAQTTTRTTATPVATATPTPAGRITVTVCNEGDSTIAPAIAVTSWGSSSPYWSEAAQIQPSECSSLHDAELPEGEYLTFLRTASGERVLSDWNHILAGARVERRFFWRDDAVCSGAPTCGGEQPITATEPTDALRPSDLLTSSTSTGPLIGPVPMAPTAATEPTDTLQPSDLLTSATSTEPLIGTDIPISMRTVGEAGDIGGPAPSEYGGVSDALVAGYRGLGGSLTRRHIPPFARRRRSADAPRGNAPHDSAALGRGFRRFRARQRASPLGCASVRCCMVCRRVR